MKDKKTQLKKVNWNDLAILLILVVLVVILAFIRPVFLTPNNLLNYEAGIHCRDPRNRNDLCFDFRRN